jgi:imidazolonepropionase-like amidohydrolase
VTWALLLALLVPASAHAEVVALVGGTVHPASGPKIEHGVVVIDGERIVSVGTGPAPAGARVIDVTGKVVTPGFVESDTSLGLVEISLEGTARDSNPEEGEDARDPIRAAFLAADGLNPRSTLIPIARMGGVTSAVSAPTGGLVAGRSAWIDLDGQTPDRLVARTPLALHIDLTDGGISAGGGARATALGRLREAFDDARLYAKNRAAYDRRAFRETPTLSRLDLEALGDALAGRIPVVVRTSRASDVLRVIDLARELGLRLVLFGVEEGWQVADRIAAARIPVVVKPLENLPGSFSSLGTRYDNAARLSAAGVTVLVSTGADEGHGVRNLRQEAGNAVRFGMSWDAALRGVTIEPARAFGMDRDYGSLAAGRVANVVVWSGDPFEIATRVEHVFIRGRDVPLRSRQTELRDRYMGTLPPPPNR